MGCARLPSFSTVSQGFSTGGAARIGWRRGFKERNYVRDGVEKSERITANIILADVRTAQSNLGSDLEVVEYESRKKPTVN